MKPLFIPLKREYFEAFERGEKSEEYRQYGARWNEKTCLIGRSVVLSLGYGKKRRLCGVISSFRTVVDPADTIPAWFDVYGFNIGDVAACIGVKLERK